MRKNVILGFVTAALVVFGATGASALALDATILGVFTSSALTTSAPGVVIDGNGDATAPLTPGHFILVNIMIDNTAGESLETIGASITFQGDQVQHVGGNFPPAILQQPGFGAQPNLGNIGTGAIKGNTPNPQGTAGDVWLQAAAYGSPGGVNGTGTQTADIQMLFLITGASGGDQVFFELGFTSGDGVTAPGNIPVATTFSSAVVNVPEPGTALLMGLGLVGLAGAGRRKS